MQFTPVLSDQIMRGHKTQTRRHAGPGPCRYTIGRDYAVQPGRGKPSVGRIRILDTRRQTLGMIDQDDARAEGFVGAAHDGTTPRCVFLEYWRLLYGAVDLDQHVWKIRFEVAE